MSIFKYNSDLYQGESIVEKIDMGKINNREVLPYRFYSGIPVALALGVILFSMQSIYDNLNAAEYKVVKAFMLFLIVICGGFAYDLLKIIAFTSNKNYINYILNATKTIWCLFLGAIFSVIGIGINFYDMSSLWMFCAYITISLMGIIFLTAMFIHAKKFKENDLPLIGK